MSWHARASCDGETVAFVLRAHSLREAERIAAAKASLYFARQTAVVFALHQQPKHVR